MVSDRRRLLASVEQRTLWKPQRENWTRLSLTQMWLHTPGHTTISSSWRWDWWSSQFDDWAYYRCCTSLFCCMVSSQRSLQTDISISDLAQSSKESRVWRLQQPYRRLSYKSRIADTFQTHQFARSPHRSFYSRTQRFIILPEFPVSLPHSSSQPNWASQAESGSCFHCVCWCNLCGWWLDLPLCHYGHLRLFGLYILTFIYYPSLYF